MYILIITTNITNQGLKNVRQIPILSIDNINQNHFLASNFVNFL